MEVISTSLTIKKPREMAEKEKVMRGKNSGSGEFERVPIQEGNSRAIIYRIVDLGTQTKTYNGNEKQEATVKIFFELVDQRHAFKEGDEEKPLIIAERYNNSTNEKSSLMKMAASLDKLNLKSQKDRENYNIFKLCGKKCLVNIVNAVKDGKTYSNVKAVTPPITGSEASYPELYNPIIKFVIPEDSAELAEAEDEIYLMHPKLREEWQRSPEWKSRFSEQETADLNKKMQDRYNLENPKDDGGDFAPIVETDWH